MTLKSYVILRQEELNRLHLINYIHKFKIYKGMFISLLVYNIIPILLHQ